MVFPAAPELIVRLQDELINPWEDRILNELIQDASALIEVDRKVVKALVERAMVSNLEL